MTSASARSVLSVVTRSLLLFLGISFAASSLSAQGIASLAIPQSREDPIAVYHAKVRELVTTVLQNWTESLERKDSAATALAYTANARSIIGNLPEAATSSDVVKQLYATSLAGSQLAITVDDFDMSGDIAFVTTVLVARSAAGDAPAFIRSMFVFRFNDGKNRWQVRQQFLDWHGEAGASATPVAGQ